MKKFGFILAFLLTVPFSVSGQTPPPSEVEVDPSTQTCVENPGTGYCIELRENLSGTKSIRGESGVDLVSNFIGVAYRYIASIIGIICVLIIVASGIQMMAGGVSSDAYESAKNRVLQALLSLLLLFSSALILKTINPGFFT